MAALAWCVKKWRVVVAFGLLVALVALGVAVYKRGEQAAQQAAKLAELEAKNANYARVLNEERGLRAKMETALSAREVENEKTKLAYDAFVHTYSGMRVNVQFRRADKPANLPQGNAQAQDGEWVATRQFDLGEVAQDIGKLGRDLDNCANDFNALTDSVGVGN